MANVNFSSLSPETTEYISSLETQLQEKSKKVETLQNQVERLTQILNGLQKSMFGQSSEKRRYVLGDDQLCLFNEAEAIADKNAPEPDKVSVLSYNRKPKRTKEELAASLPVVEIPCELEEEEKVCNVCDGKMRTLGKETAREELEIIPAQARLLRYVRYSYVCERCEKETGEATIVKAPTPAPVIKKSLASASTVAHVMYQKYVNGMPLSRQEKDWANHGVVLSRATLANWIIRSATDWLEPLWEKMKAYLIKQEVICADETVIQVLKEEGKKASTESRMWIYCSGNTGEAPVVLFEYQPTRSGEHARRFLEGFTKFLQTDGYSGYNKVPKVTRCGCWSHQRRKYEESMPRGGNIEGSAAAVGFDYCNRLFDIEKELEGLSAEERREKRLELSKPVLEAYWAWLETVKALAGSKLGEAVTYAHNQRTTLEAFLEDGRIELSNNRAERYIKNFVLGRKAWLFADTTKGAKASATAYSIVETAKANEINPYMYLFHLFSKLPSIDFKKDPALLEEFMPWSQSLPDYCRNNKA